MLARTTLRKTLILGLLFPFVFAAGCTGGGGSATGLNGTGTGGGTGATNHAPVFTSTATTAATVGAAYSYQAAASDSDGDALSFALVSGPGGLTVSTAGLVAWTPAATGSFPVSIGASDGKASAVQSWTINVAAAGGGGAGTLPASLTAVDLGACPGGMLVLSDMQEFDGKLYIAAAQAPLNSPFGAGIYYYNGTSIQQAFYDSGSQGFLRAKAIDGKLYIPDGDPNGYDPGKVYVFSAGSTTPLATNVTSAVHNFDVVKFNGELYVSGSNTSGQSVLNKFNPATSTWDAASAGNYGRLKYLGVLDSKIWCSKQIQSGVDGVWVSSAMVQSGFNATTSGGALIPCIEEIDGKLTMCVWGSAGISKFVVNPGSTTTAITGVSGVLWDVIKHTDGNWYAVAWDGTNDLVYGSTDGIAFTELYKVAGSKFGQPAGSNADGRPSIASFNGKLYVGSSTNGHLYRMD